MKIEQPIISVIVPIYNVEQYLPKCIDSIMNQSFTNIEILLVDDGSPDNCGRICDDYALRDSRVRVFHKANGGVSSARNYGIEKAMGKYLTFIDSDDWIESDMLETLYGLMIEYKAELSICGLQKEDEFGNILFYVDEEDVYVENSEETILCLFNKDKYYKYQGWVWNKLYVRELIDKYHIRFNVDIYYSEDRLFNFDYLKYITFAVFTTLPKYHYVIRANSAMANSIVGQAFDDRFSTFIPAFEEMFQYCYSNYSLVIQRAIASNYAQDAVNLYLKYRKKIYRLEIGYQINGIVRRMLLFMSFYERSVYRLFLIHPLLYQWFVLFRYYAYLVKHRLK